MPTQIAKKIKDLRESKKLSQRRFGHKVGLSAKTISAYETGKAIPSFKALEAISTTYETGILSYSEKYRHKIETKIQEVEKVVEELKGLL